MPGATEPGGQPPADGDAATDPEKARVVKEELLFYIRQKVQDLLKNELFDLLILPSIYLHNNVGRNKEIKEFVF